MTDIMKAMEIVTDQYYAHSSSILLSLGTVFLLIITGTVLYGKGKRRYLINKLAHKAFFILILIGAGELLCLAGLQFEAAYDYFNAVIFLWSAGAVVLYAIVQSILFRKIKAPVLLLCGYMKYILFFELFLLAVTRHLDIMEWIAGTFAAAGMEAVIILCEKTEGRQKNGAENREEKQSDYPNPDLYDTRKKQLDKFVEILKEQKSEPYAVMISGEWGTGKSSFVLALEKRLDQDKFIWIRAGSEKSVSEIMTEISERILEVLRQSNILVEKGSLIEKYFLAFSELLDETGLKFFNKLAEAPGTDRDGDGKAYLNSKLKELHKTIYLVIDDLDRCDREYQLKMFKVIRESTDLGQCKTIFLVDKAIFLNEEYDENYIEKYISYTLELCKVEYTEIAEYVMEDILSSEWVCQMDGVLLKGRSGEEIRQMVRQFPERILAACESEKSKIADSIRGKKAEEVQREKEIIRGIEDTLTEIRKNMTNSRKVKNFLKGIKRDVNNLNVGIGDCSPEFQKEDWLQAVMEVQFVKYMLPKIFTDIKMSTNVSEYMKKDASHSVELIFGLKYLSHIYSGKKEYVINRIVYEIDIIDFRKVKTEKEKCRAELHSDEAVIRHICQYAECAQYYEDLYKILDIYEDQEFDNAAEQENFLRKLFRILSEGVGWPGRFQADEDFLEFSRRLLDCMNHFEMSEKEIKICVDGGQEIIRSVIAGSQQKFKDILYVVFGLRAVELNWTKRPSDDLNRFYFLLKELDKNNIYHHTGDGNRGLTGVINYYKNVKMELSKDKYQPAGVDFVRLFADIDVIFEICAVWGKVEQTLSSAGEEPVSKFNQYFMLVNMGPVDSEVFRDVYSLEAAMDVLQAFYESERAWSNSRHSLLLLRLGYKILLQYEEQKSWFGGREKSVCALLTATAEKVYSLYRTEESEDEEVRQILDEIRIFVYRFNTYCGN